MTSSPVLLITGGNTGLGYETLKALLQSSVSYTILLGGRSIEKANAAVSDLQSQYPESTSSLMAIQIDIENDDSISNLVEVIKTRYGRLDILINNAGAQFDGQYAAGKLSLREMWDKSWSVNTTSTQVITTSLVPLLLQSSEARLIFITSGTSTLTEHDNQAIKVNQPPEKGWPKQFLGIPAYRACKTGLNMVAKEWARILKNDGVKVSCISPGQLATGLGPGAEVNKQMGAIDPAIGGNFVRTVVEGARDADDLVVVRKDNVQPW